MFSPVLAFISRIKQATNADQLDSIHFDIKFDNLLTAKEKEDLFGVIDYKLERI